MKHFDVVDLTDSQLRWTYDRLVVLNRTTVLSYQSMSNAIEQMSEDILRQAGPAGAGVVRIWGHGLPGVVGIAAGTNSDDALSHHAGMVITKDFATGTMWNNVTEPNVALKPLARALSPTSRLELRGCAIGAAKPGEYLGKALAKLLSCRVYAGVPLQAMFSLDWTPPVRAFPPGGKTIVENAPPPRLLF